MIAVDLPRPGIWERILDTARRGAGTLLVPLAEEERGRREREDGSGAIIQRAGLDLASDIPGVADWLASVDGPLVLGNYVYADGAANVRLSTAVDALTVRLQAARADVALSFLATPTDVFAVPAEAVAQSVRAYANRSRGAKLAGGPCRCCPAGACSAAPTCPGPTRGSTTAW